MIGRVTRPHGVGGELRVLSYTESAESFSRFDRLLVRPVKSMAKEVRVTGVRPHKKFVLLKLYGVINRDQAESLVDAEVLVKREWLPPPAEDEYYWTDLIGLSAFDEEGRLLGVVKAVMPAGSEDLLVLEENGREVILPFHSEVVLDVDPPGGRLTARPPQGLLEI